MSRSIPLYFLKSKSLAFSILFFILSISLLNSLISELTEPSFPDIQEISSPTEINFSYAFTDINGTSSSLTDRLISINKRSNEGLKKNLSGGIDTYFAKSSIDFDQSTLAELEGIQKSTNKRITIIAGSTYQFVSNDGTKGLIRINHITNHSNEVFNRVANFSIKVLE